MFCISVLSVFLFLYPIIFRPRSKLSFYFILVMASCSIWSVAYTLELAATDSVNMDFFGMIEYIGIVTLPVLFFLFTLYLTKEYSFLEKPLLLLLFFPPLLHYMLRITHNLFDQPIFYLEQIFVTTPPFVRHEYVYGPGFYSHTIYSYIFIFGAFYLLIRKYLETPKKEGLIRNQLLIFIVGASFPILGNIIRISGLFPFLQFVDFTVIGFVFSCILFTYALFELGFLDILPIARQHVFDEIYDMLIVIDTNLRIVDYNNSAHKFVFSSLPTSEIVHKDLIIVDKLLTDSNLRMINFDEAYQGVMEVVNGIRPILNIDCEFIFFEEVVTRGFFNIFATPLKQANKIVGAVILIRDLTARREAETALRQKNQMQEIILELLSHDLRNHINVLKGYSELAQATVSSEEIKESLEAINQKSNSIFNTINEVTNYLRIDKLLGSLDKNLDLNQLITDAIESISPECSLKKATIEFTPNTEFTNIWGNAMILNSVLVNLLHNAVKYSPPNGKIQVRLEELEDKDQWLVSIADQGPGIPEELQEEIFKPFISLGSEKGVGLGLFIAKTVIESFAGDIWMENNSPLGATFYFTLPKVSNLQ